MYDLLLKGGTVIDTSQQLNGRLDIAINDGIIKRLSPNIPIHEAAKTVDVSGKLVTPGLIDLHTHIVYTNDPHGISNEPDTVGVYAGVTTIVDAGSAGSTSFQDIQDKIIPKAHTEIIAFMNINRSAQITLADSIDIDETVKVGQKYRDILGGIKIRMVGNALQHLGMELPKSAKEAARQLGTKVMVHIGDTLDKASPNVSRQLFPLLDTGDIVTHMYTAKPGGILDANGKLFPEARDLPQRGVWLDTAHGHFSLNLDIAKRALDQEYVPHCISTDASKWARIHSVHSLTEAMTRFLALGLSIEDVITATTINPAKAIGQSHRLGSLAPGHQADVSILAIKYGDWILYDCAGFVLDTPESGSVDPTGQDFYGNSVRTNRAIIPVLTVKKGLIFPAGHGPRAWGWEPDTQ